MLPTSMISTAVLRTLSDERLAVLAADGSDAAFEAIVLRYRRMLLAYCRHLLLADSRGEDVVQQAFISAWTALRDGAEVRELRAWLRRITHNQAVSMLRRPGYDFAELSDSIGAGEVPEDNLERRTLMRETLASLAALPTLQREAILRTAIAGHSYEEVAAALGISDQAVRGLVYRARISLRSVMAMIAPPPVVAWAAGHARRPGHVTEWIAGALGTGASASGAATGATAGGASIVLKGAAVIASSFAVLGSTVGALAPHLTFRLPTGRVAGAASKPVSSAPRTTAVMRYATASATPEANRSFAAAPAVHSMFVSDRRAVTGGSEVHLGAHLRSDVVYHPAAHPLAIRRRHSSGSSGADAASPSSEGGGNAGSSSPTRPGSWQMSRSAGGDPGWDAGSCSTSGGSSPASPSTANSAPPPLATTAPVPEPRSGTADTAASSGTDAVDSTSGGAGGTGG